MQTEIEVKYLDVDEADIRKRLKAAGGVCEQSMRLMRRTLFEEPQHSLKNAFIRVRDEGDKVTLTYKQRNDDTSIHGTQEIEIVVSDFDTTVNLLMTATGWQPITYQESRRETWYLDDVEVVIDEWPWISPYIEIEGPSEEAVKNVAERLGFAWKDMVLGSVDVIYERDYPKKTNRGVIDVKEVRFGDAVPRAFLGEA